MLGRSVSVRFTGFHRYAGNARQVCEHIVNECWNGSYFQTSAGHFSEFWTRDFGWCVDSLLKLGYRREVLKTLAYALERFSKAGGISTTISPSGKPFNFPCFAPDSLPFLMHALNSAKAKALMAEHRDFLEAQAELYGKRVIDPETGLVADKKFSSIKDGAYRRRSCYDTAMVGMLAKELGRAKIRHSLPDAKKILMRHYWTGSYFLDDLSGKQHVAGDAQVFPFWTGVITDNKLMKKSFDSASDQGLDYPFPLKYTAEKMRADVLAQRAFAPNYEGNSIWAHMGLLYTMLLRAIDPVKAKQHIAAYKNLVEANRNFFEVYEPDGSRPYRSLCYVSDEGMLWAANLLTLL
ncbi:MAG: hypothetical protein QXM31_00450 [Candidatus Woesearchaeota archaeon]